MEYMCGAGPVGRNRPGSAPQGRYTRNTRLTLVALPATSASAHAIFY